MRKNFKICDTKTRKCILILGGDNLYSAATEATKMLKGYVAHSNIVAEFFEFPYYIDI